MPTGYHDRLMGLWDRCPDWLQAAAIGLGLYLASQLVLTLLLVI